MKLFVILLIPFSIGFIIRLFTKHDIGVWLLTCTILPAAILIEEFLLPYSGGGASFWPIALFFGGFYGAISSGMGVVIASYIKKKRIHI